MTRGAARAAGAKAAVTKAAGARAAVTRAAGARAAVSRAAGARAAGARAAGARAARLLSPTMALVVGAVMLAMMTGAILLAVLSGQARLSGLFSPLLYLAFAAVGVLVAYRQPRNAIGWLLLAVAFFFALAFFAGAYDTWDFSRHHGRLPLGLLTLFLQPSWAPAVACAGLSLLVFPDGSFPSRRWRHLLWAYLPLAAAWVGGTAIISAHAIATRDISIRANGDLSALDDPAASYAWWKVVGTVFFLLIAVSWVAWLAGQAAGYRRQSGERRHQLKWLLSGACVFVVGTVTSIWLGSAPGLWRVVSEVTSAAMFALPVSIGIGILKFRLYDIDRIVSRTVAYAIVTGLLVGVYTGLVLLTTVLPLGSSVGVAAATLVAAALFNPLRRRVQRVVDRRFNRARYNAEQTIVVLNTRLQDAVDLDSARDVLLDAVQGALEPAHLTLWVNPQR